MSRKTIQVIGLSVAILSLVGCNQTVEEQVESGIENVKTVFEAEPAEVNAGAGQIELYLPNNFSLESGVDESNYTLTHKDNSYILFVNPNESESSQLHYDILKQDTSKTFIKEQTFEHDGAFGFTAVTEVGDGQYELIVSVGGVKLTTQSSDKKIDDKLEEMMEIVQSVKLIEQ